MDTTRDTAGSKVPKRRPPAKKADDERVKECVDMRRRLTRSGLDVDEGILDAFKRMSNAFIKDGMDQGASFKVPSLPGAKMDIRMRSAQGTPSGMTITMPK